MKLIKATDKNAVKEAAEVIRSGGLVAFPTDTVYGLGANARNADAVGRIYKVKGRERNKPLAFLVADKKEVLRYVDEVPKAAQLIMESSWPGPVTIILKGAGGKSVAFRMPDCPFALDLIKEAGVPIVATSANISGESPPVDADPVVEQIGAKIDLIVDGGRTKYGEGSSVVDLSGKKMKIVREGPISGEEISSLVAQCKMKNEN